jgi:hypothetical protein
VADEKHPIINAPQAGVAMIRLNKFIGIIKKNS